MAAPSSAPRQSLRIAERKVDRLRSPRETVGDHSRSRLSVARRDWSTRGSQERATRFASGLVKMVQIQFQRRRRKLSRQGRYRALLERQWPLELKLDLAPVVNFLQPVLA